MDCAGACKSRQIAEGKQQRQTGALVVDDVLFLFIALPKHWGNVSWRRHSGIACTSTAVVCAGGGKAYYDSPDAVRRST